MSKLYSVGVTIHATAYIVAESAAQAAAMAQEAFAFEEATVSKRTTFGEVPVSDSSFEGLLIDGPAVSLSPAMTFGASDTVFYPADVECVEGDDEMPPAVARATFIGQAWINDHAIPVDDGRFSYLVTAEDIASAGGADPEDPEGLTPARGDWDDLRTALFAPPQVRAWAGPFEIVLSPLESDQ